MSSPNAWRLMMKHGGPPKETERPAWKAVTGRCQYCADNALHPRCKHGGAGPHCGYCNAQRRLK